MFSRSISWIDRNADISTRWQSPNVFMYGNLTLDVIQKCLVCFQIYRKLHPECHMVTEASHLLLFAQGDKWIDQQKQQMDDRRQNQIEKFSNETFTCTTFCLSRNQSNFTPVKQLCMDCHKRNFWQTDLSICWDGSFYCMGMVDLFHLIVKERSFFYMINLVIDGF